MRSALRGRLE